MKSTTRLAILDKCKNGEQWTFHKSGIEWKLRKPLSFGVTLGGFPFVVWETKDFGSIQVGESREGVEPKSRLRNDARSSINLNDFYSRMQTAERMSERIVY